LDSPRVYFDRGEGAWLWDVDGNDYVDYLLGQGPNFLGHAPADITAAVTEAVKNGMVFGAQTATEVEAGERFLENLRWADMVRFGLSGTEAVQAALRVARARTGRTLFVRFEGQYHGWLDNVLVTVQDHQARPASAGQLEHHLNDSIMVPWNDLDALSAVLAERGADIAAVLMEPVMCNQGSILPLPGYLEGVRRLCDETGALLIFDEVITGFRIALGGATEAFGVVPDLATYGKAMAGGWPVAALAGKGEHLAGIGTGTINHSGTFNASVMSMAAVAATMRRLAEDPPYASIERHGTALMAGLKQLATSRGIPLHVQGCPAAFHVSLGGGPESVVDYEGLQQRDLAGYARLAESFARHGVWVARRGIWYVSAEHGDTELKAVLERVEAALENPT
jgi:glutamate-1-semialdehyde 2,1-aminomutase